jgi:hypothetical protein
VLEETQARRGFDTAMVADVVPRRSEPDDIGVSLDGAAPPDCKPRWRGRRLSSMPALMTAPNIPLHLRDPDVSFVAFGTTRLGVSFACVQVLEGDQDSWTNCWIVRR